MELEILKLFDRTVPDSLKWDIKEIFRSLVYYKNNLFNNDYETFSRIEIETNTNCNRACRICPYSISPRPLGYMSQDIYNLLLDQLSDIDYKGQLAPCFYNEPLLDKRLPDLIRNARTVLPKAQLTIYTNGSLLTTRNIHILFNSGLDGMVISQYEENLPKDNISHILSDLPQDIKKKIRYRVLRNDQYLSTRGGLVKIKKSIKKKRCYQASTDVIVDYKGNILLCCNDYKIENVFGNIGDKHIKEIWNQPDYKKVRKELRKGNFKFDICKACAGYI